MSNRIVVSFDIVNENDESLLLKYTVPNTVAADILTDSPILSNPVVFEMALMRFLNHYAATPVRYLYDVPLEQYHQISEAECDNIGDESGRQ